jgi:AICAR transformylase/IMP cyclohydrolase PurH
MVKRFQRCHKRGRIGFKHFTATRILEEIENTPESRKDWMLYRFEYAGKYDRKITNYRFWQDKSHPIELLSSKFINQKMNYIHQNPVRAGFVANAEDYLYSSARNYADLYALIKIEMI